MSGPSDLLHLMEQRARCSRASRASTGHAGDEHADKNGDRPMRDLEGLRKLRSLRSLRLPDDNDAAEQQQHAWHDRSTFSADIERLRSDNERPDQLSRRELLSWVWSQMSWSTYVFGTGLLCVFLVSMAQIAGARLWAECPLKGGDGCGVLGQPAAARGALSPTNGMDDEAFALYGSLTLWLVIMVAGLGSEAILGQWLVRNLDLEGHGSGIALWHAAQLFFALCIAVAVFSHSPFGAPPRHSSPRCGDALTRLPRAQASLLPSPACGSLAFRRRLYASCLRLLRAGRPASPCASISMGSAPSCTTHRALGSSCAWRSACSRSAAPCRR